MKRNVGLLLFCVIVLLIVIVTRRRQQDTATTLRGTTMGTSYTLRLAVGLTQSEQREWQSRVQTVVDRVNRRMSTYQPDSEVSQFNRYASDDWFAVSRDTAEVVTAALDVARWTDGAFDITVAPLVNLWSFGPDQRPLGPPTEAEIAAALRQVDYRKLQARLDPPALRKEIPDLSIDLSGIAKGYAVDQLSALLDEHGVEGYMIEIGGEIRTKGTRLDGQAWRIALESPQRDRRAVGFVLDVQDCCLASSGDYRNYFEWEGRLYSHEIDPRTGRPVQDGLASVSVIGPSVMLADALATALMVLTPDEAWRLAQEYGWEVLLVMRDAGHHQKRMTPGFPVTSALDGS